MEWGYVIGGLMSLGLSVLSVLCVFFNPVTLLFMQLAAPVVRLLGRNPPVDGWSSLDSAITISLLWPLTLAPLHWLNYRVLQWNVWGYVGLLLLVGVLITMIVLFYNAYPLS
jgi:hypothetical protein